MAWLSALSVALSALAGASGFPSGLEPVAQCRVAAPEAQPGDPYPERIELAFGTEADFTWVNGHGYVHAPLSAVWAALQDPEVLVDRRKVAVWTFERREVTPAGSSLRIRNTVRDLITVEIELTWRQGIVEGTAQAPLVVSAVYRKTAGTKVVRLMFGSVVARKVSDSVTEIELVEQIDAITRTGELAATYNRDLFESIAARAKGLPLPRY
jgi:hypothetical protein